jgi:hypothetical protein
MSSLTTGVPSRHTRGALEKWRGITLAIGLAAVIGGCASSAASPTAAAQASIAGATATPTPTPTSAATPTAASTPTTAPTSTPTSAPTAGSKATPPALAAGLCKASQLKLTITAWIGDPGAGITYPHVTATNVSSTACNMRGSSQAEILNAGGGVIAKASSGAAKVVSSDPVYTLAHNGTISTIIIWGNWCKAALTGSLRVAMVEPFGLGKIVSAAMSPRVPTCYDSYSGTAVSSEAWLP